jgi:hypothetical protein
VADTKPFEGVAQATLKEIAQALLQMKANATSISNTAGAFEPMTDHPDTLTALGNIVQMGEGIRIQSDALYRQIAREASR